MRMPELSMASAACNLLPTVLGMQLEDLAYFHPRQDTNRRLTGKVLVNGPAKKRLNPAAAQQPGRVELATAGPAG
jgi:hypothetical protein